MQDQSSQKRQQNRAMVGVPAFTAEYPKAETHNAGRLTRTLPALYETASSPTAGTPWIGLGVYNVPRSELPKYRRLTFGETGFEGDAWDYAHGKGGEFVPVDEGGENEERKFSPFEEMRGWHLDTRTGMPNGRPKLRQPSELGFFVVRDAIRAAIEDERGWKYVAGIRIPSTSAKEATMRAVGKSRARTVALAKVLGVGESTIRRWKDVYKNERETQGYVKGTAKGSGGHSRLRTTTTLDGISYDGKYPPTKRGAEYIVPASSLAQNEVFAAQWHRDNPPNTRRQKQIDYRSVSNHLESPAPLGRACGASRAEIAVRLPDTERDSTAA